MLTDTSKNTGEDMNADEFKQINPKYFVPQYTHFDRKMKLDDAFSYVTNSENIKKHKFFPFISYTKKIGRLQVQIEQDLSSNYISGIHLIKKSVEQFIRSVVA